MPTVLFGISGSIAAYKSIDVIRLLRKASINVTPVFSETASKFVTPWTVETIAESPLLNDTIVNGKIMHLDVCKSANVFVICPTSANVIAKLASGQANDILSASFLNYTGPKILFPAMHTEMYTNPITQKNIEDCRKKGITVIEPTSGALACGDVGVGRLIDPQLITDIIQFSMLSPIHLSGQHIVITAGGTSEPIDPVRSITNSASGKSGHVLANMAAYFGAKVTLIRTTEHPILDCIDTINVTTAEELKSALIPFATHCDKLIMNAAISDFTVKPNDKKLNRQSFDQLNVTPTDDVLKAFNQLKTSTCKSIGYCLSDSEDIVSLAKQKMQDKGCDAIIANGVESFGAPRRSAHIISKSDHVELQDATIYDLSQHILSLN